LSRLTAGLIFHIPSFNTPKSGYVENCVSSSQQHPPSTRKAKTLVAFAFQQRFSETFPLKEKRPVSGLGLMPPIVPGVWLIRAKCHFCG